MIHLAFYLAKFGSNTDRIIDASTGGDGFSHVEFVFDDGLCFSSSRMDGGCRFKAIDLNLNSPHSHWRTVTLSGNQEIVRQFCESQEGKPYDLWGALGVVLPFRQARKAWFCSEIVTAALQRAGHMPNVKARTMGPNRLYRIC